MKKYLIILFCLFTFSIYSADITESNQHSDYSAMLEDVQKTNKSVFLYITAPWCSPCNKLQKEVINPLWAQLQANHVCYVINIQKETEISRIYQQQGLLPELPAYYILDKGGKNILVRGFGNLDINDFIKWHNSAGKPPGERPSYKEYKSHRSYG